MSASGESGATARREKYDGGRSRQSFLAGTAPLPLPSGTLIDRLKSEGIYDSSMIILLSDHGEEFWEHGSSGHGYSLHDENVRVPLIVRWPGVVEPGSVSNDPVSSIDFLPTLAEIAGRKVEDPTVDGPEPVAAAST